MSNTQVSNDGLRVLYDSEANPWLLYTRTAGSFRMSTRDVRDLHAALTFLLAEFDRRARS